MRILIAEDDAVSRVILRRSIEHLGHECVLATDGLRAWELFQEVEPNVVISDWVMPGMEGLEFCQRVRSHQTLSYTYFIFMTSLGDKAHFLTGMSAGADDYLIKPVDMDDLQARLIAASRVTSLHQRLIEQNLELERLGKVSYEAARLDPLTGVGNRLKLREDLEAIKPRVTRYGARYSAALCDVDHFKKYNDHHGHLAGDETLRAVASTLKRVLRDGDSVFRYGGEEFLALLPEQSETSGRIAMERVRLAIEALRLPHGGEGAGALVSISIGIASLLPDEPFDAWIKRADEALYRAKNRGRNRVEIA